MSSHYIFYPCTSQIIPIRGCNRASGYEGLTLCLHAGADESERVTGELTAGARHGAASQQDHNAGVGAVGTVLLQVAVLQGLKEKKGKKRWLMIHRVGVLGHFSQRYVI